MPPTWVIGLVLAILGAQALFWLVFILWLKRRSVRASAELTEQMTGAGEVIKHGPAPGLYRGASFGYSRVSGNGTAILTNRRLLFRKVTGGLIDVPLDQVTGLREDKWFLSAYRSGRLHTILRLASGDEVGFIFQDHAGWMDALRDAQTS